MFGLGGFPFNPAAFAAMQAQGLRFPPNAMLCPPGAAGAAAGAVAGAAAPPQPPPAAATGSEAMVVPEPAVPAPPPAPVPAAGAAGAGASTATAAYRSGSSIDEDDEEGGNPRGSFDGLGGGNDKGDCEDGDDFDLGGELLEDYSGVLDGDGIDDLWSFGAAGGDAGMLGGDDGDGSGGGAGGGDGGDGLFFARALGGAALIAGAGGSRSRKNSSDAMAVAAYAGEAPDGKPLRTPGGYKCKKCGMPKKGHVCPFG